MTPVARLGNDGCRREQTASRWHRAGAGGSPGPGGLREAAAGRDGQSQQVEMTFFAAEPAVLALRAAASSN